MLSGAFHAMAKILLDVLKEGNCWKATCPGSGCRTPITRLSGRFEVGRNRHRGFDLRPLDPMAGTCRWAARPTLT